MILPDVNVLVYALRTDSPHHATCRAWLAGVVGAGLSFGMSPLVLNSVVRIATDKRIFAQPSDGEEVFRFCDNLLGQPHCVSVEPGHRHWAIFRSLCLDTRTLGRRTTDAWLAALAIENGCEWITMDRDFGRFPGLRWGMP